MIIRVFAAVAFIAYTAIAAVPTPEAHFGHRMGADRKVLDWEKVVSYFNALPKSSDRIVVRELGKSTEGRPFIAAWISSADTIKNLEQYRAIQDKLADPRKTTAEEAAQLAKQGKAIVLITCSIHSTEIASTHTAVEFAHRLLTEDSPKVRAILDNTIFILVPSLNPDGVDIVTKWYRYTLGSQWEGTSPPQLYQKYLGHDNNRDWYIFSQVETKHTVSKLHNVWHPQIVYDVHQQGPYASRMFVPPWMDPVEPNIDPIIVQWCNAIGSGMAADLTAAGKTGVAINAMYDFWTPARHYQAYHGGLRILSESASARIASPITVRPDQIQGNALGYEPRSSAWNHLEPWLGGTWTLRDIVDYQLIAMESSLYQAAVRREDLLKSFYEVGRRAVARTSPWAFVFSPEQFDPGAAQRLLETLKFGQVEIDRAADAFQVGDKQYPKGSYLIRMQQPYSSWAKTLLEKQNYPDLRLYPGGPPKRPYDVTAHTLPMLMGVQVDAIDKPLEMKLQPAGNTFPFRINRAVATGVLPGSDVEAWRVLGAAWQNSPGIFRDPGTGDFYLMPPPDKSLKLIPKPRIGLYKSNVPSMDEGWTRWILDQFSIPYTSFDNGDVSMLTNRANVIVFPDQSASTIAEGYRPGVMPPQYAGGLVDHAALREFVNQGGTAVFMNHSTDFAIDVFGLKVKNVVKGLSSRDFYSPGSILNNTLDPKHPISWGLPENIHVWSEGSPAWDVPEGAGAVVARYPAKNILASGWLLGEKYLAGKASIVDVTVGKGHVVLFGMRPQYRGQSYQTFKALFNSFLVGRY